MSDNRHSPEMKGSDEQVSGDAKRDNDTDNTQNSDYKEKHGVFTEESDDAKKPSQKRQKLEVDSESVQKFEDCHKFQNNQP